MARLAFIGLGHMGAGMAASLRLGGHEVRVYDLDPGAVARLAGLGAVACTDVSEACRSSDGCLTMLPDGKAVRAVMTEAMAMLAPGSLLIDCSTIDVETARHVSDMATAGGFDWLDAPVSGGMAAAQTASLTFMAGGTDRAFARAETILRSMGKAVIHAGAAGAGQAAKLCNNMLLAITMIGTCEAFVLAEKLGLDAQVFFDIASKASGQNWSMTSYCPVPGPVPSSPANRGYAPGFSGALMLKDLILATGAAAQSGATTPLGDHARDLYAAFCREDNAHSDFSAIYSWLNRTHSVP